MDGNVIELTDRDFDQFIQNSRLPVFVVFWAKWAKNCSMMATIVDEIAKKYIKKVKICMLNTDDGSESAIEFGINAIPTLILVKNGKLIKKWVGLATKKELSAAVDQLL